ncbi:hypothetical protein [Marinitenerispora sediminis]|uniref:hypothetical protein n=1 Tax=Marinitenerispora sediminis TaxID=1931232 RepID=UPI00131445D7|nr:hypothetical protein [Marinitenerispora sediminis]
MRLLPRIWQSRHHMGPYAAACVAALAESLRADLVTIDAEFSRTSGLLCPVRHLSG